MSRRKTPIIEEAQFNPTRGTPTRRPASAHRNCTSLRCKPSLNIAEAGGISGSLHAFECRQLVAGVVGDEWEEMPALSARREYLPKDGQIIRGGPDHYARIAGTKHCRDFLMAGRPQPKHPEQKHKRLTLPELEEVLRANKALQDPTQTPEQLEFAACQ